MHINANGDIEPCAFIHYSDSNIKYKSFIEALQSPLFMSYKDNQPFDDNLLKPCPLLDNPDCLISMVKQSEATSTDLQSPEEVEVLCARTAPVAAKWSIVADRIWKDYPPERLREARNRVEKWKNKN